MSTRLHGVAGHSHGSREDHRVAHGEGDDVSRVGVDGAVVVEKLKYDSGGACDGLTADFAASVRKRIDAGTAAVVPSASRETRRRRTKVIFFNQFD